MDSTLDRRDPPTTPNIPSWVDSRQRDIQLTCLITPIFTTILIALRLYARKFITRSVGRDDWVAAFTLILCIIFSVLLTNWANNGGGMHQDDLLKLGLMDDYYLWVEISSPVYILACLGYKISILLLYLRLFSLQKWTIRATWFTMFVTAGYLISNLVAQVTGCQPIQKFWDKSLPGQCIDFVASNTAFGSLNVITDFMIFVIPIPAIWQSTFSWKDKVGASMVFLTGAIAFAASLVRFQYAVIDLTAEDRTYLAGLAFLWMVLEINTGLMCSCGPALKPLYRKFFNPEQLEKYAPKPIRHALNNSRQRPHSLWNINAAAALDTQRTLTANDGHHHFHDPWRSARNKKLDNDLGSDLELQDVGGVLGSSTAREDISPMTPRTPGFRRFRALSDAPTVVEANENAAPAPPVHDTSRQTAVYGSNEAWIMDRRQTEDMSMAMERQASFV